MGFDADISADLNGPQHGLLCELRTRSIFYYEVHIDVHFLRWFFCFEVHIRVCFLWWFFYFEAHIKVHFLFLKCILRSALGSASRSMSGPLRSASRSISGSIFMIIYCCEVCIKVHVKTHFLFSKYVSGPTSRYLHWDLFFHDIFLPWGGSCRGQGPC